MIHQIDHMNSFEIEEECQRVLDFCLAEGFYIFTVIHHVQSNDQKKFYRDRTLYSAMRLLYVIVHIRSKTDIDEMTKGENDFTANISHLKQLNKLLLTKIKQYEIVQPLEMMVFKQIKDFLTEFETLLFIKTDIDNESFEFKQNESTDRIQAQAKKTNSQLLSEVLFSLDQF